MRSWTWHRPGAAGRGQVMTLVHAILLGADSIDDCELLAPPKREGARHRVMAPSTLGTFLRGFTFGHVRQLDRSRSSRSPAPGRPGGPASEPMVMDLDSTICEVHGYKKQAPASPNPVRGYHRCLPPAQRPARCCTSGCAGARPTRCAGRALRQGACCRVRRAGASGQLTIPRDSGFWAKRVIEALQRHQIRFSISSAPAMRASPGRSPRSRRGLTPIDYTPAARPRWQRRSTRGCALSCAARVLSAPKQSSSPTGATTPSSPTARGAHHARRRPSPARRLRAFDPRSEGRGARALPSGRFFANAAWAVIAGSPTTCALGERDRAG